MEYKKSDKQLLWLLEEVEKEKEFQNTFSESFHTDSRKQQIENRVLEQREKLWNSAAPKISLYEQLESNTRYLPFIVFFLILIGLGLIMNNFSNARPILDSILSALFNFVGATYPLQGNVPVIILLAIMIASFGIIIRPGWNFFLAALRAQRAVDAINAELIKAIRFELRESINYFSQPSYEKRLSPRDAKGLEEGYDRSLEVETKARIYTEKLIAKMSHGSIGIAGPRGTGKTTLLNAARDFQLSVNSSHVEKGVPKKLANEKREIIYVQVSAPVIYSPREFILYLYAEVCRSVIRKLDPDSRFKDSFGSKWLPYLLLRNILKSRNLISIIFVFSLIAWGSAFLSKYSGATLEDLEITPDVIRLGLNILLVMLASLIGISAELTVIYKLSPGKGSSRSNILRKAFDELNRIKYQQTFSDSWGGKLNLAVFEANSDKNQSFQEYEMTLPEVTFSYRSYIASLTNKFLFIIAIDEMDKIEDSLQAQSFLNDLKNILNLDNCFYLVSVSQNAMSSFELRGLPFRDAFDSTFDEVVHVSYLDFNKSSEIIKRRILGFPETFLQLAFCLSGGLPRDLIRVTRKIILLIEQHPDDPTLGNIAHLLLSDDLIKKMDATRYKIQENNLAIKASNYLLKMDNLQVKINAKTLFSAGQDFIMDGKEEKEKELQNLIYHLGLYMVYVSTLLSFFVDKRKDDDFKKSAPNLINDLVNARQRIGLSGEYTLGLIKQFRKTFRMPAVKVGLFESEFNDDEKNL